MKITFSRHALEQARERGISINEVRTAMQRGSKHFQKDKIVSDYAHIRLVYKLVKKEYFIITVMIRIR